MKTSNTPASNIKPLHFCFVVNDLAIIGLFMFSPLLTRAARLYTRVLLFLSFCSCHSSAPPPLTTALASGSPFRSNQLLSYLGYVWRETDKLQFKNIYIYIHLWHSISQREAKKKREEDRRLYEVYMINYTQVFDMVQPFARPRLDVFFHPLIRSYTSSSFYVLVIGDPFSA